MEIVVCVVWVVWVKENVYILSYQSVHWSKEKIQFLLCYISSHESLLMLGTSKSFKRFMGGYNCSGLGKM